MYVESALEIGGIFANGYGTYQSAKHHEKEILYAKERHEEAKALAIKNHKLDMMNVKKTYLLDLFFSLEQHFQQLNADLISNGRESERDMFDQRNQSYQTIILASSVMFSALSTVIVQGYLPTSAWKFILVGYALFCSLSFTCLFLCIVICIEVIRRASTFMYIRARKHSIQLQQAVNDTKKTVNKLRPTVVSKNGRMEISSMEDKEVEVMQSKYNYLMTYFN